MPRSAICGTDCLTELQIPGRGKRLGSACRQSRKRNFAVCAFRRANAATPGQLSLAWMLCKKPWIVPIPGSRKEARIRENLQSQDVLLTPEEIGKIDALIDTLQMPVYGQGRR